jgi:hypothetical protein
MAPPPLLGEVFVVSDVKIAWYAGVFIPVSTVWNKDFCNDPRA